MRIILVSILIFFSAKGFSQLIPDTTIDEQSHKKFIIDSSHKCVMAFDSTGKQLWLADVWHCKPWKSENDQPKFFHFSSSDYIMGIGLAQGKIIFFKTKDGFFGGINIETGEMILVGHKKNKT